MSAGPLPRYLDIRKVFPRQARVAGSLELARLPRLRRMLAGDQARIRAALHCRVGDNGLRLISGQVDAALAVTCQRCLEPVQIRLHEDINLAVLDSEEQGRDLDPALDPWICRDFKLDPADLLEEQLMLCLPVVNYHRDRDCLGKTEFGEEEAAAEREPDSLEHPFAVLKTLKES